jgi:hypothetical protein
MNYISINYALVYQLTFAKNYKWTKCGKCFNTKTGKELNQKYNSRCLGYYIKGKFYSLTYLKHLEIIKKSDCPF